MRVIIFLVVIFTIITVGYFYFQRVNTSNPESAKSIMVTRDQAVENVKKLPEVQKYLKDVSNAIIEVDNEDAGEYNVHVYEVKNGHTATFNWYYVSVKSGEVKPEFKTE